MNGKRVGRGLVFVIVATCAAAAAQNRPSTRPASGAAGAASAIPDLLASLKTTPGCLDAVAARVSNGQQAIFAFFEDKQAAIRWYKSPAHRSVMKFAPAELYATHEPLADVPDGVPVMAIASLTMGKPSVLPDMPMPVSQISIELYTPLSGGIALGGGFSPKAFRDRIKAPATQPATQPAREGRTP